jgi:hypothetical protein
MTDPTAPETPRNEAAERLRRLIDHGEGWPDEYHDLLDAALAEERRLVVPDHKTMTKIVGKALYGWGDDEPNEATGHTARFESSRVAADIAALASTSSTPDTGLTVDLDVGIDVERLASGIAYALARADLPMGEDTSRDYAERLAPLVLESGWLYTRLSRESDR